MSGLVGHARAPQRDFPEPAEPLRLEGVEDEVLQEHEPTVGSRRTDSPTALDDRPLYPGRWLVRSLAVATVLCGLIVVAWLGLAAWSGDSACEFSPGTSLYGEATVSWLPPGRTCTYVDVVPGRRTSSGPSGPDWACWVSRSPDGP